MTIPIEIKIVKESNPIKLEVKTYTDRGIMPGGAEGQVLTKNSGDDYDVIWGNLPDETEWGNISGNINNQTDLKNILDSKIDNASLNAHINDIDNPHATTKSQIGLGNVNNTSDLNKPISLATQIALDLKADNNDLSSHVNDIDNPHSVTKTQVGLSEVDNTSDVNKPVSSATQTALNLKYDASNPNGFISGVDSSDITTALGFTPENNANKGQNNGYASLDAGGKIPANQLPSTVMEFKGNWDANTNTPALADGIGDSGDVYLVSVPGTQDLGSGDIEFLMGDWVLYNGTIWEKSINSSAVVSVNGQQGVVVLNKNDVGLSNVDNTSDVNKPISSATQTALNLKADSSALSSHVNDTTNPHSVTATQVGLGNVDNTSDVNKPVSSATQTALNLKYDASNPNGFISGVDSNDITTALGFTPENSANKGQNNGYASLDDEGTLPVEQIPPEIMQFKGNWNASTNVPELVNGTGETGDVYFVSDEGQHDFGAGDIDFEEGDWVIYNGSIWQKIVTGIPPEIFRFTGNWNANTNTPTLSDGTGEVGHTYLVSDSGTQDLGSGDISFEEGDWVIYTGSVWQKVVSSIPVESVNSKTGVVVLDQDDIGDGTTYKQYSQTEKTKLAGIADNANNYTHPNHTGDVTSTGDGATVIANDAVTTAKILNANITLAKIENFTAQSVLGRGSSTGVPSLLTAGNDGVLRRSGSGNLAFGALVTANLGNDIVNNTKLANMATKTYKGRTQGTTGDPEDVPVATLKSDLNLVKGDVGLGNVDNTSDANKPVSTAQQTALDAKVTGVNTTKITVSDTEPVSPSTGDLWVDTSE